MSSTNFSDNETLPPPKLENRRGSKPESATASEGSLSMTTKSPKMTINNKIKRKSALRSKHEQETKPSSPRIMHKGESSKSAAKRGTFKSSKSKVAESDGVVVDTDWTDNVRFCPTYYPTREEFKDPVSLIHRISAKASKFGICKIVSPLSPLLPTSEVLEKMMEGEEFRAECLPNHTGYRESAFKTETFYTVSSFEKMADEQYAKRYKLAAQIPPAVVEKDFWRSIAQKNGESIEYINGLTKSAFSVDRNDRLGSSRWNLKNFARLPQSALRLLRYNIPGVTDSLLNLGMLFSYSFWSAEPGHLYSIDYHHCGAPRTWYGSPNSASYDFEKVVKEVVFPEENLQAYEAYDILSFKAMLFSPSIMLKHDIPLFKTVQYPGEFVITFPKAYHMEISHGFNCWEAASFATPHWFPFGEESSERRALYHRPQLVPYQELLCKDAMDMFLTKKSKLATHVYKEMKINFAYLIRIHHLACEDIKTNGGAQVIIAPHSDKNILCWICKRECYLAYISCGCFHGPVCIFHKLYEECACKRSRVMFMREEFLEMQNVAKSFENENNDLLKKVEHLMTIRGGALGFPLRMDLDLGLDESISLEEQCRKLSPRWLKKPRTRR